MILAASCSLSGFVARISGSSAPDETPLFEGNFVFQSKHVQEQFRDVASGEHSRHYCHLDGDLSDKPRSFRASQRVRPSRDAGGPGAREGRKRFV